jgi:hypothetical protein
MVALLNERMNPGICSIFAGPLNPPSLGDFEGLEVLQFGGFSLGDFEGLEVLRFGGFSLGDFEGLEVPQIGGFRGQIHTVIQQRPILSILGKSQFEKIFAMPICRGVGIDHRLFVFAAYM